VSNNKRTKIETTKNGIATIERTTADDAVSQIASSASSERIGVAELTDAIQDESRRIVESQFELARRRRDSEDS